VKIQTAILESDIDKLGERIAYLEAVASGRIEGDGFGADEGAQRELGGIWFVINDLLWLGQQQRRRIRKAITAATERMGAT
jgi:hypothetical protein